MCFTRPKRPTAFWPSTGGESKGCGSRPKRPRTKPQSYANGRSIHAARIEQSLPPGSERRRPSSRWNARRWPGSACGLPWNCSGLTVDSMTALWAESEIEAALLELSGLEWKKVRNFLRDQRCLSFLDRMHRRLAEAEPRAEWREAMAWRWWGRHGRPTPAADPLIALVRAVAWHARSATKSSARTTEWRQSSRARCGPAVRSNA